MFIHRMSVISFQVQAKVYSVRSTEQSEGYKQNAARHALQGRLSELLAVAFADT
jgi:hypothetical protein